MHPNSSWISIASAYWKIWRQRIGHSVDCSVSFLLNQILVQFPYLIFPSLQSCTWVYRNCVCHSSKILTFLRTCTFSRPTYCCIQQSRTFQFFVSLSALPRSLWFQPMTTSPDIIIFRTILRAVPFYSHCVNCTWFLRPTVVHLIPRTRRQLLHIRNCHVV